MRGMGTENGNKGQKTFLPILSIPYNLYLFYRGFCTQNGNDWLNKAIFDGDKMGTEIGTGWGQNGDGRRFFLSIYE